MTELECLICFWESVQNQFFYLMEPSTQAHIHNTIKYLKQLQNKER